MFHLPNLFHPRDSAVFILQCFQIISVILNGENRIHYNGPQSSVEALHFYTNQPAVDLQSRVHMAPWETEDDSDDNDDEDNSVNYYYEINHNNVDNDDDEEEEEEGAETKDYEYELTTKRPTKVSKQKTNKGLNQIKVRHRRSHRHQNKKQDPEQVDPKELAPKTKASKNRRSVSIRLKEKKILDSVLGKEGRYDKRIRPAGVNSTDEKSSTIVKVNIFLRSITDIDDYKMEYSVQITFRQRWNDERLKFDDLGGKLKYLTLTDPGKVWMPDTFFRNEKVGHFHAILVNNVYVRIFPNGDVLYSIRISLTLACPMDLKLYPMDRQNCSLMIASYGYTTDDITYLWDPKSPVQIENKTLNLPRFSIEKYTSDYCNVETNTGTYSCLKVDLYFKRQFSYYLITIYVPGCMLVIVSWVSFWLDPHAVPARVALGVTTLLTMSTQTASINSALPPVAYTKAIDVWQGVCVTFVFSALLEYALVNYALRANRTYFRLRGIDFRRGFNDGDDDDDEDDDGGGGGGGGGGGEDFERERVKQRLFDQEKGRSLFKRTFGKRKGSSPSFMQHSNSGFNRQDSHNLLFANLANSGANNPNSGLNSASTLLGGTAGSNTPMKRPSSPHPLMQRQESKLSQTGSVLSRLFQPFNPNLLPHKSVGKPSRTALLNSYVYSMERAKRIDVVSRVIFPTVFAVFNMSYWIYYLIRAAKETIVEKVDGSE